MDHHLICLDWNHLKNSSVGLDCNQLKYLHLLLMIKYALHLSCNPHQCLPCLIYCHNISLLQTLAHARLLLASGNCHV